MSAVGESKTRFSKVKTRQGRKNGIMEKLWKADAREKTEEQKNRRPEEWKNGHSYLPKSRVR